MFVLMQHKAVTTLTHIRAHRVDALVLAAAVVLAALIFVCETHTYLLNPNKNTFFLHCVLKSQTT